MFATEYFEMIEDVLEDNSTKCLTDFPLETRTVEKTLKFMHRMSYILVGKERRKNQENRLHATHILFSRNLYLLLDAYRSALSGNYGSCNSLLRTTLENFLLIRYFIKDPPASEEWLRDIEWYRKKGAAFIRRQVLTPEARQSLGIIYAGLSSYIHPSTEGWDGIPKKVPPGIIYPNRPYYDRTIAKGCLSRILFFEIETLKSVIDTYVKQGIEVEQEVQEVLVLEERISEIIEELLS